MGIGLEQPGHRLPTPNVVPLEGCFDHCHFWMPLHDGIIDGFASNRLEVLDKLLPEIRGPNRSANFFDVFEHFRLIGSQRIEDGFCRP